MRSPTDFNGRRVRSRYGGLSQDRMKQQQPQAKSGWLATLGRALRDNVALIAALLALAGVIYTQVVTTNNAREGLANQQALEEYRAREAELQTYLDDVGAMILDEGSPLPEAEPGGPMSSLARAKTLTIFERLDAQRKRIVLQFLYESQLIHKGESVVILDDVNLRDADLSDARLFKADLGGANLSDAVLSDAFLNEANLSNAFLSGADLSNAFLRDADLSNSDLGDADLGGADLKGADLRGVRSNTSADLENLEKQAQSLKGATMPDGSKHD